MDPDACLDFLLRKASDILKRADLENPSAQEKVTDDEVALAEHIHALNGWMCAGGFPPKRWRKTS